MPSGGAIEIVVENDTLASTEPEPASISVVYDNAGDLAFLRALIDVAGWEVRFYRGDGEAIDSFRQGAVTPPEVLLLDFAETDAARVDFFVMMVKEYAPDARLIVIADSGKDDQRWEHIPGIAGVLTRPLDTARVLEQVRTILEGLRAQRRRRSEVVVRFSDTGAGIPAEILARIFDPFFTTKEAKGTGLGLSVVHKILENHGASVQVGSSVGKGTVFTLSFPQTQADGTASQFRLRPGNNFGRNV